MQKKKILYFDYWTVGIHNFKVFDDKLKEQGFETKLLHLNSWKGIEAPEYQQIEGIDCYDISFYRTNQLFKVLKREHPAAVVMLNLSFTTDRTIILSCRKLGIKSIYLMHGSLTREDFINESIKVTNQNLTKNRLKRALKHLKGTVLNYLYAIIAYDIKYIVKPHAYKILLKTFIDPGKFLHFPPPAFDLKPDLALVYGWIDKEFYEKRFLLEAHSIKVVGNPDLDRYFREIDTLPDNKEAFCTENNIPVSKPYVTYIEEGLVEDNIWDNSYRIKFLTEINNICNEAGCHLVIKLHPRTAKGPYLDSFQSIVGATILTQVNFPKLIYFTTSCISHYSTTLVYALLMNKPIFVPRWALSADIQTIYTNKEVTFVHDAEDLKRYILNDSYDYERHEYLNNFVPFKDGKTSERISTYILDKVQ